MRQKIAACGTVVPVTRERFLMDAIDDCTRAIVRQAMASDWDELRQVALQRRELFTVLRRSRSAARHGDCIDAIGSALRESDDFLTTLAPLPA